VYLLYLINTYLLKGIILNSEIPDEPYEFPDEPQEYPLNPEPIEPGYPGTPEPEPSQAPEPND
jgi:hypothetical protein